MPSIYKRICDEYAKTRRLPYAFMPPEIGVNGLRAMMGHVMPPDFQLLCARRSWDAAFNGAKWSIVEPIWFADAFLREAKARIADGEKTAEEAAAAGRRMATDSDKVEAVEIGMLLMSLKRDDLVEQIMERLALHAKFTSVAIAACRDWLDYNARIFRWLQNSCDCGAVMCALALKPETDLQRRWLFENGLKVGNPQSEMARCILGRPSMGEYIRNLPDAPENFHALCRLTAYAPELTESQAAFLAMKLLPGLEFAEDFIDLCAMHRMQRELLSPEHELYPEWVRLCDPQRWKLRSRGVIEREMDAPRETAALLAMVLTGEGMIPPLERLKPIMAGQDLPQELLRFLLLQHGDIYAPELLELMLKVCPPAIFEDMPTVRDPREYPDGRYDIWLAAALGCMSGDPALQEKDVRKCLRARSAVLRAAALDCIELMSEDGLSDAMEKSLAQAIEHETDDHLRRRMQRQQHGANPSARARIRCALPAGLDVTALAGCAISGVIAQLPVSDREMYSIDGLHGLLAPRERLLLLPAHGEEPYALLVTPGGVVMGTVPLTEDAARMLAMGGVLIAVPEESLYADSLHVEVYRPLHALTIPAKQSDADKIRMLPIRK